MTFGVRFGRTIACGCAIVGLSLAISCGALAAPTATELGPQVALAHPAGGFIGRLKVEPDHGPVGTPVTVTGEDLPAGQKIDLVWGTVTAHWNVTTAEYQGREFTPAGYRIADVASDAAGGFVAHFLAPDDFGFLHDIRLQQGGRLLAQDAFAIDMTVKLLADNVPVGTLLPIEVNGIGWRELEDSWVMLYDNRFTGWISTITTAGHARFTVPAVGQPGRHVIEVIHSDFTFPYRNKQQSPSPDRPQFKIGFTIAPGPAVLPPPAVAQAQVEVRRLPPQGELVATPASSGVDQPVVVRGSGFAPKTPVALHWATLTGNRMTGLGWEDFFPRRCRNGGRRFRPGRVLFQDARRSRRRPRAMGGCRRNAQDRLVLDRADRAAARRRARASRDHVPDSSQGGRLERDCQHLHRCL